MIQFRLRPELGKYEVIKVAPDHASNCRRAKRNNNNYDHDQHLAVGDASTTEGEGPKKKRTRTVKSTTAYVSSAKALTTVTEPSNTSL